VNRVDRNLLRPLRPGMAGSVSRASTEYGPFRSPAWKVIVAQVGELPEAGGARNITE
jgi:hypothetical protein